MKAIIPSHRESKRHLLLRGKNLKKNVSKSIKEYIGILGIAEASPRWIKENILMINRKSLGKVRAAFCLSKEKIEVLKVSGTLKGLKK